MSDRLNTTYDLDDDSRVFNTKKLPETPVRTESSGITRRSLRQRPTPQMPGVVPVCSAQLRNSPKQSSNTRHRRNNAVVPKTEASASRLRKTTEKKFIPFGSSTPSKPSTLKNPTNPKIHEEVTQKKTATANATTTSGTQKIPKITTPWTGMTPYMAKQRTRSRATRESDIQVPKKAKSILRTPTKVEMMSPRQWELKTSLRNSAVRTHSYGSLPPRKMLDPIRPVSKLDFDDDDKIDQTPMMTPYNGSLTPKSPEESISKGQLTFEETPMKDNIAVIEDLPNPDSANIPISLITPKRKENSAIPLIITPWGKMAADRGVQSIRMRQKR
nr:hypothetical protein HmN_000316000 [Hymenolepis microstoma]